MIIHVNKNGAEVEFEDTDSFTHDEELAMMVQALPSLQSMMATLSMRGLAPVRAPQDAQDDGQAVDARTFVQLLYH